MAQAPRRFVALFDAHWGYERRHGRTVPLHDERALALALRFIGDFNPHELILGGDMLDCGAISHHNDRKPGRVEGLRLFRDARELRDRVLRPLEHRGRKLTYIIGNHEDWLNQVVEGNPGLEGIVEAEHLLGLEKWNVVPQGGHYNLGKLTFMHGDQVSGGEACAKSAVLASERSVRFGHYHTYQAYTKVSTVDSHHKHTGISIPCLCQRGPGYGKGKANRWINGFLYGYVMDTGQFSDYVVVITKNTAVINGKVYKG